MIRLLFLSILLISFSLNAAEPVKINDGFALGNDYFKMEALEKRSYAMGLVDGMLLSPMFDAPKSRLEWFENCILNMSNIQVAAIIEKYLKDNPQIWHYPLHVISYSAMKSACIPAKGADKPSVKGSPSKPLPKPEIVPKKEKPSEIPMPKITDDKPPLFLMEKETKFNDKEAQKKALIPNTNNSGWSSPKSLE